MSKSKTADVKQVNPNSPELSKKHVQHDHKNNPGKSKSDADPETYPHGFSRDAAVTVAASVAVIAIAVVTAYGCAAHPVAVQRLLRAAVGRYVLFWRPAPPGDGLPLGHHRPPLAEHIDQLDRFPHPVEFFRRYTQSQRPVIFRGLARMHPAFHLWTDDYLSKEFGNVELDVEQKKKEDRKMDITRMNMSKFLSVYKQEDLYVVHSVQEEMARELVLPRSMQCGGLQRLLFDIVLWFSSGGTRSVLHYDELDNLNCVLDGHKQFFLVDVDDAKHIDFDHMEGLYSSVDVTSVDMYKFPGLRDVPWYNVTLWKGDCFYLPYKWPHHVRSSDSRNVAVNLWFSHLLWLNESDCADARLNDYASLGDYDPPESAYVQQAELIGRAEGHEQLTLLTFADLYADALAEDPEAPELAFDVLDADSDGLLRISEMYGFEAVKFLRLFPRYIPHE